MSQRIPDAFLDLLRGKAYGHLATLMSDGAPQLTPVWVDVEETPEGHVVRYDEHGRIAGLTVVNARWLLDRDGAITVTLPQPQLRASTSDLAEALGLAS
jgi:uncharacterized protein YuzE